MTPDINAETELRLGGNLRELALFAGAGGGLLASRLLGWSTVCAVELESYPRQVLLQRQLDGHLERFPIWDDVCTFDGNPWRGAVDIVTGGFPCQDISSAGTGKGLTGESSGLVWEMLRIVGEVQPRFVFAENSPFLRTHGLGSIVCALDAMGYDVAWCVLGAWQVGAPHRRNRLWLLAHTNSQKVRQQSRRRKGSSRKAATQPCIDSRAVWRQAQPSLHRVDDGVARRVDQIKAIGNGQVPQVAALAFQMLTTMLDIDCTENG